MRANRWLYGEPQCFSADKGDDIIVEIGDIVEIRFIRNLNADILEVFGREGMSR